MVLSNRQENDAEKEIHNEILRYAGTPYDYSNLLLHQIIRTLSGAWIGRRRHTENAFICHEFVQTVYNKALGIFPEYYKGDVSKIYYSTLFQHTRIK